MGDLSSAIDDDQVRRPPEGCGDVLRHELRCQHARHWGKLGGTDEECNSGDDAQGDQHKAGDSERRRRFRPGGRQESPCQRSPGRPAALPATRRGFQGRIGSRGVHPPTVGGTPVGVDGRSTLSGHPEDSNRRKTFAYSAVSEKFVIATSPCGNRATILSSPPIASI